MRTIDSQVNANLLLNNTSSQRNKYVCNPKIKHLYNVSLREILDESEWFFTKYDSSIPETRTLYVRKPFILMKQSMTNSFNLSISLKVIKVNTFIFLNILVLWVLGWFGTIKKKNVWSGAVLKKWTPEKLKVIMILKIIPQTVTHPMLFVDGLTFLKYLQVLRSSCQAHIWSDFQCIYNNPWKRCENKIVSTFPNITDTLIPKQNGLSPATRIHVSHGKQ